MTGIEKAIRFARTQQNLAALLSVSQGRISEWFKQGYVPRKRAPFVATVTGVPLEQLTRKPKPKAKSRG